MKIRMRTTFAALTVAAMASSALALSPEAQDGRDVHTAALTVAMNYGPLSTTYGNADAFRQLWAGVYDTGAALGGYDIGWILTA